MDHANEIGMSRLCVTSYNLLRNTYMLIEKGAQATY